MNPFLRNFATLLSGNGLAFAVQFAAAPILARVFTEADFGVYANVMAVSALISVVAAGRYEQAIVHAGAKGWAAALGKFTLKLTLIGCVASFIPLWIFKDHLLEHYAIHPVDLLWLAPIIALLTLTYGILVQVANSQGKYKLMASCKLVYAVLVAAFSALMGLANMGAAGLLLGVVLGFVITMFFLLPQWREVRKDKLRPNPSLAATYKDFPRWNMPLAVVDTLNQQFIFNLLFTSMFGVRAMGFYAIGWRYLRAPSKLVQSSAAQLFYREASNDPEKAWGYFVQTVRNSAVFAIPLAVLLGLWGQEIFGFVLGDSWLDAGRYAEVLAPMIGLGLIAGSVSTVPILLEKQRAFTIVNITGQALALGTLWWFGRQDAATPVDALFAYTLATMSLHVIWITWFAISLKNRKHV